MADQNYIQELSDNLAARIGDLQAEVVESMLTIVKDKKTAESIQIINDLNILNIITLKSQSIMSEFESGLIKMLEKKEKIADINEDTIMAFFQVAKQEITGELATMANILKKEVINGVLNNKIIDDILESIRKQGYGV
tara:strand:+ start:137 stop:550 length:414 start_codon:yes stop_codon:yes gene_type:complete